jgi:hypothetical protein
VIIAPCSVDLTIFLLLLRPLTSAIKESCACLRGIEALIDYGELIDHDLWLLHGDLFYCFEVSDAIAEGDDDLDVLDVQDDVPGVAEMLGVVTETFIMLLLDGLHGLSGRWSLICPLKVPNEYGVELIPSMDGVTG